jgi:hypothetical protein
MIKARDLSKFLLYGVSLLVICTAANAENCDTLWNKRNSIFKSAGYCFKLPRAISTFGNAGCRYDDLKDVPLLERERNDVDKLSKYEASLGCAVEGGTGPLPSNLHIPPIGSPDRSAIMDALRLATKWKIKFKVNHLLIFRSGNKSLAVVDVSDAAGEVDNGGTFELEGLNLQWRALYTVGGGGGADDCPTERSVLNRMIQVANEYSAPREIFPPSFWELNSQNKSVDECVGSVSRSFVEMDK